MVNSTTYQNIWQCTCVGPEFIVCTVKVGSKGTTLSTTAVKVSNGAVQCRLIYMSMIGIGLRAAITARRLTANMAA